jgi:hypothetical protein
MNKTFIRYFIYASDDPDDKELDIDPMVVCASPADADAHVDELLWEYDYVWVDEVTCVAAVRLLERERGEDYKH